VPKPNVTSIRYLTLIGTKSEIPQMVMKSQADKNTKRSEEWDAISTTVAIYGAWHLTSSNCIIASRMIEEAYLEI